MYRYIFIFALAFISLSAVSQIKPKGKMKQKGKEKEKTDSATVFLYNCYTLDENNHKLFFPLDTVLNEAQLYTPLSKKSPSWSSQTNLGQAVLNNEYFGRKEVSEFIFWQGYEPYWRNANQTKYYNLNSPYTKIDFSKAQKSSGNEQVIRVMHTRNFSDKFNVGVKYNVLSSPGLQGHRNRAKHSRFEAFLAYSGLRYKLHASGSSTKIETQHNGGFVDGKYFFHKDSLQLTLTTAGEKIHDMQIFVDQEYLIGKKDSLRFQDKPSKAIIKAWASIRHQAHYTSNYRIYSDSKLLQTDSEDPDNSELVYYPNAFLDSDATLDSMHFSKLRNTLELEIKEGFLPNVNFGLRGGLMHEVNSVYNFRDYTFTDKNSNNYFSWGATAALFNRVSDYWAWKGNASLYLAGYKKDDLNIKGEINRYFFTKNDSSFIQLRGGISRIRPNYFLNSYYSNHYVWENSFEKEENINASLHYIAPHLRMDVGVDLRQSKNFVYMNEKGIPAQNTEGMLTYAISLRKKFTFFKHWGFDNVLIYQHTTNQDVLQIPKWITHQSLFYDRSIFNDATRMQIGADFTMTAKFNGAYFNPATGMYQIQNSQQVGEFPIVSAFVNMRLRQARIFFKFNNMYQYFNKEWLMTSAYSVDSYSMFRWGVSWYFAD